MAAAGVAQVQPNSLWRLTDAALAFLQLQRADANAAAIAYVNRIDAAHGVAHLTIAGCGPGNADVLVQPLAPTGT